MFSPLRENFLPVRKVIAKSQYNLSLGLHSTVFSPLNPINSQGRNACFSCKLCLAHEQPLSDCFYGIRIQFILSKSWFPDVYNISKLVHICQIVFYKLIKLYIIYTYIAEKKNVWHNMLYSHPPKNSFQSLRKNSLWASPHPKALTKITVGNSAIMTFRL